MPMPFDMLAVMLCLGWYAESPPRALPSLAEGVLLCLAALPVMALFAAACNFLAIRALRRPGRSRASRRNTAANAELAVRLAQIALFAAALHLSALPWTLADAAGIRANDSGSHVFAVQMFGLIPYIGLFFAGWLPLYRLHTAISRGAWTHRSFIVNKARYNLYMIAAWAPFAFLADLLAEHLVLLPFLFAAAAWIFPAALAKLWGCAPLPPGETLDLVKELEAKTGAAFSKVFLWEPGGGAMNAAAVGLAKPFRYLFLTPGMIRGVTREELAAVILHELGHVKNRHLLFYLFTTLAGMNASAIAAAMLPLDGSAERFAATAALILLYFRFAFGWLSRKMERQADFFALEHSGSIRPSRPLSNALEKLGLAAGHIRLADSWHHSGIADRVNILRTAERRPELVRFHNAGIRAIKAGGYIAAFLTIAFTVRTLRAEFLSAPPDGTAAAAESAGEKEMHRRRVAALAPEAVFAPEKIK